MLDRKVKDWTTDVRGAPVELTYRSMRRSFGNFLLAATAVWLLLFGVYRAFPLIQNGAAVIAQYKRSVAQTSKMFGSDDQLRIVSFGNSKVLAGFRPSVFDSELDLRTSAYNLAIPGDKKFLDLLESCLMHGNRPTHVFLQVLPKSAAQSNFLWSILLDNKRMVNFLFPFRSFVRDAIIFLFESRSAGGPFSQYKAYEAQVKEISVERGYHFIKSQSHYPGDRLPDEYRLPTDKPHEILKRDIDTADPQFAKLMQLAEKFDFQVLLVPVVLRRGEFAEPPPTDLDAALLLKPHPRAHVIGPPYLIYDPAEFSDPVHLNIPGANRYSKQVATLFRDWLNREH